MVSNARLDFPLPLRPVMTIILSRGSVRSIPLRLCSRAPVMTIDSCGMARPLAYPVGGPSQRGAARESTFGVDAGGRATALRGDAGDRFAPARLRARPGGGRPVP